MRDALLRSASRALTAFVFVAWAVACGSDGDGEGSDAPAFEPAEPVPVAVDWLRADPEAGTVEVDLVAGEGDANAGWNFAGFAHGAATVVVPTGARVTITLDNRDESPHSLAVVPVPSQGWSVVPEGTPAFAGASTGEAVTESETITFTFTADTPGDYALACLVPGHAAAGMWLGFQVRDGAEAHVLAESP